MKALYIHQLRGNPEVLQQKHYQTITGAKVFEWDLLCALLEFGTYDAYFAPGVTEEKKDELVAGGLSVDSVKRLVSVSIGGPLPVGDSDQVVLASPGRHLDIVASLRQKLRLYNAAVCGFIHAINSPRVVFAFLQQCFAGLSNSDILFCSSRAGMKTVDVYIHALNRLLPSDVHYPVRRVLVPLGVTIPTVEPNAGIKLRHRLNADSAESVALYFGRLSQASKCDLGPLLVTLSHLSGRGKNLHLIIAGDNTQANEAARLQTLARELGCHKQLSVWPNPSAGDKHLLYSGADIFVSPSDNIQETYGLTVAEAMAYGLPSIVSDWDGYRDLVKEGESGFSIPSVLPTNVEALRLCDCTTSMSEEDSLAQSTTIDMSILSDRLETLARDRALQRQMGQAAKRYVENHCSWKVVVRRYEQLWDESLRIGNGLDIDCKRSSMLLNLSVQQTFGHYATTKRSLESKCFITVEGREWLERPARLYFLCRLSSMSSPRQFADMLRRIVDCPGVSVRKLVDSLAGESNSVPSADAHWMLARLFKYGLVKGDSLAVSTAPELNQPIEQ